jgi:hypothetical protein
MLAKPSRAGEYIIQKRTPSVYHLQARLLPNTPNCYDNLYSRYGDLGATVHAILLDPEARSPTLDADPTFGRLHEPLLKVMHDLIHHDSFHFWNI